LNKISAVITICGSLLNVQKHVSLLNVVDLRLRSVNVTFRTLPGVTKQSYSGNVQGKVSYPMGKRSSFLGDKAAEA